MRSEGGGVAGLIRASPTIQSRQTDAVSGQTETLAIPVGYERLQFENVLRKGIRRLRRAAQSAQRELVGAGSATESEIDAARKETGQRPELLGNHIGRMIGQHYAAGADPDGLRPRGDMGQHDRRRCAGDARHIVMLRNPDAAIAPSLRMGREIAGVVERAAGVRVLGDATSSSIDRAIITRSGENRYAASLGQRKRVAHIPTAEAEAARSGLILEGQGQARLHLKSNAPWSHEWGPVHIVQHYLFFDRSALHPHQLAAKAALRDGAQMFPASEFRPCRRPARK